MDMKVARGGDSKAGELPKAPAAGVPPTTNPIDIALETGRHDPDLESPARRVLQKNERLIEAQTAQLGRQRWRDFIITALGVCVLAGACLLVWDASQAKGVVVEPFAAPPDLVERGLSGPVLAAQMLDKLSRMQAQTESTRAASTYANDWGGDIEIEIPNTGVSIGEVRRYLRAWLGDQTRLSGEVFRLTDGRLAVTTRVGTNPATRGEGAEANLDALLQQGAEAIYAETQPFRYAVWLVQQNRNDEAKAVFQALVAGSDKDERLWGYYGLSNLAETSAERHRNLQAALRLNPRFTPAMFNLAMSLGADGREEQGYTTLGDFVARAADALFPRRTPTGPRLISCGAIRLGPSSRRGLQSRRGQTGLSRASSWGDALMMQNKPSEAARKYREAVRLAPAWGALHLALGRAQAAAGQTEAARGSFSAASRMDLSPADRTAVTSLLN